MNYSKNYQFIVISIDSDRKANMLKQFRDVGITERVTFIPPATIENQTSWFPPGIGDTEKKILCCMQSHFYSLEMACLASAPEFTVILEDDVAFHKTQFKNTIEEIIARWEQIVTPHKMVSIGWVPITNRNAFENYTNRRPLQAFRGASILRCICSGTQGYIVRKTDIQPLIRGFIQPTYAKVKAYIETLKETYPRITSDAIDTIIPYTFQQCIVYPPVVLEQPFESHLQHSNWSRFWAPFFMPPYTKQLDDYNLTVELPKI